MADIVRQQAIVKLNVGGVPYQTSLGTLTRYPGSLIADLSASWNPESQQPLFIDFDGDLFKYVLDYLRFGDSVALEEGKCLQRLLHAAEYFKLPGLKAIIQRVQAADGVKGLSGTQFGDFGCSRAVKLTKHGLSTIVDSFVGNQLRLVGGSDAGMNRRLLGVIVPIKYHEDLGQYDDDPKNPSGHSVSCTACNKLAGIHETAKLEQLRQTLRSSRSAYADQLGLMSFEVVAEPGTDCVVIRPTAGFGSGSYHIAKSYLCFV